jgi:hypothetical protein
VVEENFVVNGPFDLEGGFASFAFVLRRTISADEIFAREKLEVPKVVRFAPTVGGANFDGEVGRFDFFPNAHLVEDASD